MSERFVPQNARIKPPRKMASTGMTAHVRSATVANRPKSDNEHLSPDLTLTCKPLRAVRSIRPRSPRIRVISGYSLHSKKLSVFTEFLSLKDSMFHLEKAREQAASKRTPRPAYSIRISCSCKF